MMKRTVTLIGSERDLHSGVQVLVTQLASRDDAGNLFDRPQTEEVHWFRQSQFRPWWDELTSEEAAERMAGSLRTPADLLAEARAGMELDEPPLGEVA